MGKYQLIRILGQGRSGTVYLAKHLELDAYRAIKQVPRSSVCYEQFRREALLLKRLRHPCIPIVYDLEEDSQYSYLMEEFLEGDSLYDLVQARGPLNQDAVIRYGIQICGLVQYLHSAETIPILYLDLQPRNLLVCHGQVKLLDFDHSDTLTAANAAAERYGTEGFAAPEQREGGYLDVRTDVYQIGAVLSYMAAGEARKEGLSTPVPGELGAIIRRCLNHDVRMRYASAEEVGEALGNLHSNTECLRQSRSPSLTIILSAARPGAGVTHIAIGLAVWLNRHGYPALYEEHNRSGDVRAMGERLGIPADSYGIHTIMKLPMKPRYGKAVRLSESRYPFVVKDYGAELLEAARAAASNREAGGKTVLLAVCGGKWWDGPELAGIMEKLREMNAAQPAERLARQQDGVLFLFNHAVSGALRGPSLRDRTRFRQAPYFPDPFHPDQKAESFYEAVMADYLKEEGRKGRWDLFTERRIPWRSRGSSA